MSFTVILYGSQYLLIIRKTDSGMNSSILIPSIFFMVSSYYRTMSEFLNENVGILFSSKFTHMCSEILVLSDSQCKLRWSCKPKTIFKHAQGAMCNWACVYVAQNFCSSFSLSIRTFAHRNWSPSVIQFLFQFYIGIVQFVYRTIPTDRYIFAFLR